MPDLGLGGARIGQVNRKVIMTSVSEHALDTDVAGSAYGDIAFGPDGIGAASPQRTRGLIEEIVASVFDVDPEQLRRPTRGLARIALARQVAMYIAHIGFSFTLTEVGELFDRDRTTVAHACKQIEQRREDVDFDALLVLLEQIVRVVTVPSSGPAGTAAAFRQPGS